MVGTPSPMRTTAIRLTIFAQCKHRVFVLHLCLKMYPCLIQTTTSSPHRLPDVFPHGAERSQPHPDSVWVLRPGQCLCRQEQYGQVRRLHRFWCREFRQSPQLICLSHFLLNLGYCWIRRSPPPIHDSTFGVLFCIPSNEFSNKRSAPNACVKKCNRGFSS